MLHDEGVHLIFKSDDQQLSVIVGGLLYVGHGEVQRKVAVGHLGDNGFFAQAVKAECGVSSLVGSNAGTINASDFTFLNSRTKILVIGVAVLIG